MYLVCNETYFQWCQICHRCWHCGNLAVLKSNSFVAKHTRRQIICYSFFFSMEMLYVFFFPIQYWINISFIYRIIVKYIYISIMIYYYIYLKYDNQTFALTFSIIFSPHISASMILPFLYQNALYIDNNTILNILK